MSRSPDWSRSQAEKADLRSTSDIQVLLAWIRDKPGYILNISVLGKGLIYSPRQKSLQTFSLSSVLPVVQKWISNIPHSSLFPTDFNHHLHSTYQHSTIITITQRTTPHQTEISWDERQKLYLLFQWWSDHVRGVSWAEIKPCKWKLFHQERVFRLHLCQPSWKPFQ